jgi:hypothetical protein
MYLCGGSPDFFYFHIWTTEVISYNALNLEFANFETPCIILNELLFYEFAPATDRDIFKSPPAQPNQCATFVFASLQRPNCSWNVVGGASKCTQNKIAKLIPTTDLFAFIVPY